MKTPDIPKFRIQRGMLTYLNRNTDKLGIQLYWPHGQIRHSYGNYDIWAKAETNFRITWGKDELGFGFSLLGFGIGVIWVYKPI